MSSFVSEEAVRRPAPRSVDRLARARRDRIRFLPLDFSVACAAGRRASQDQIEGLIFWMVLAGLITALAPATVAQIAHASLFAGFLITIGLRCAAGLLNPPMTRVETISDHRLPRYTVLVPLFREAPVIEQLVRNLSQIDYPPERLEILFLVETIDADTRAVLANARLAAHMRIVVVPEGSPRTKPRACNFGLAQADGQFLVIYDAEDQPDPGQLREAAARFADGSARLACLQAPLRINPGKSLLSRCFALDYAILFELTLPAQARLGLPFPLGGTSNHFRTDSLRNIGGWDPFNVTEDADLGIRLHSEGFETATLSRPTLESAPPDFRVWLPQRARWLKGFLQTVLVGFRQHRELRWPVAAAIAYNLILPLAAAALHLPALVWLLTTLLIPELQTQWLIRIADLSLFSVGWIAHTLLGLIALHRIGRSPDSLDCLALLLAPFYWCLLSLAFLKAVTQFFVAPHQWDKTPHLPDAPASHGLDPAAA